MSIRFKIEPQRKISLNLAELWKNRELFYYFTWRDLKVKYKQTVLGLLWTILQPLIMTLLFTLFLGDIISVNSKIGIPYPVFALSGMLLWNIFSSGVNNAANSMVSNANIIKKIYFPRLIIPFSAILVSLVDFLFALIIFIFLLFIYRVSISPLIILYIPLAAIIVCITTSGFGMLLAAMNVKYRDVRYIIPFFVQGLMFISPVIYPISITNNSFAQTILKLNPLSGAFELFRGGFTGYEVNFMNVLISFGGSVLLFILGVLYFKKTENFFADLA
ncbi:ABC transporter permease [Fluviicola chungangensis]|uniref:Transport permease protein n=1 Tax=Fluviicola chungangensis TaxID=2597671 RepID=A0A556MJ40_9FLAO|nr:ABC transporter permease [Fluviicola chungangensis]TSJ39882.1 ABC transporter permease [Fluviicola chungangensis]